MKSPNINVKELNKTNIDRITVLWAFSEAALGGILHILKIPLTGLFVGSSAIIFITLLSYFSNSRKIIIESTLKVILVKFVVSPYSPVNAYFAVIIQSLLGYVLFYKGFNKISPIILGFLALLFSACQKIIVLTVIFGMTFWESIDIFFFFIVDNFLPNNGIDKSISLSYVIIALYFSMHVLGGIFAGLYAAKLPERLREREYDEHHAKEFINSISEFNDKQKRDKKNWWFRPKYLILLSFFLSTIVLTFLVEDIENTFAIEVSIMIIRSILIIVIWYYFISPVLLKIMNKYLTGKSQRKAEEIDKIVKLFPKIKSIVKYSWQKAAKMKLHVRIFYFLDTVLITYITLDD